MNARSTAERTALHLAVIGHEYAHVAHVGSLEDRLEAMGILIDNGCDLSAVDTITQLTARRMATQMEQQDMHLLLLSAETAQGKSDYGTL